MAENVLSFELSYPAETQPDCPGFKPTSSFVLFSTSLLLSRKGENEFPHIIKRLLTGSCMGFLGSKGP
ncbi:hypothetical protein EUGRSUZ_G02507 [Eucalyptus grandis]|uniref:Uncharacterized protein n=2 Tax=Eucalyptus grandis TaxID=71139 RepID=A0ACC3K6R5_EUCGR|nr:hypothetical protein EUGRSUZ_G02507 [Eucalyptus grandis]